MATVWGFDQGKPVLKVCPCQGCCKALAGCVHPLMTVILQLLCVCQIFMRADAHNTRGGATCLSMRRSMRWRGCCCR